MGSHRDNIKVAFTNNFQRYDDIDCSCLIHYALHNNCVDKAFRTIIL